MSKMVNMDDIIMFLEEYLEDNPLEFFNDSTLQESHIHRKTIRKIIKLLENSFF